MEVIQHQGKSLRYLTVHPESYVPGKPYPLVILLHGFGASMRDLATLAPAIHREGYIYACPNAPMQVPLGPGMVGYGWTPVGGAATPQDVQQAETLLEGFFTEVLEQYQAPPGRALLLGFSQGGAMTYRCGLGRPDRFAGLAALSAVLPDLDALRRRLPLQRSQPIFISHGLHDPLISVERAREARSWLTAAGYAPFYREYPMGHEISPMVLADLVPWAHQVLPPLASKGHPSAER
jgi:phospholipase/carboxylesterase